MAKKFMTNAALTLKVLSIFPTLFWVVVLQSKTYLYNFQHFVCLKKLNFWNIIPPNYLTIHNTVYEKMTTFGLFRI